MWELGTPAPISETGPYMPLITYATASPIVMSKARTVAQQKHPRIDDSINFSAKVALLGADLNFPLTDSEEKEPPSGPPAPDKPDGLGALNAKSDKRTAYASGLLGTELYLL